ncbi:hypothetical protein BHM03_00054990 [Ensete ventricosum]|nr:hypothetical protein BHM03_00054990 [Ensete ventricosum]
MQKQQPLTDVEAEDFSVVQDARSELEPKCIGVPGECQPGGLHEISDDTKEKADAARREEQRRRSGEVVLAARRGGRVARGRGEPSKEWMSDRRRIGRRQQETQ